MLSAKDQKWHAESVCVRGWIPGVELQGPDLLLAGRTSITTPPRDTQALQRYAFARPELSIISREGDRMAVPLPREQPSG